MFLLHNECKRECKCTWMIYIKYVNLAHACIIYMNGTCNVTVYVKCTRMNFIAIILKLQSVISILNLFIMEWMKKAENIELFVKICSNKQENFI